jgi:putative aldouronate transport system permease protein
MKRYRTVTGTIFDWINHIFLIVLALLCILPLLNVLAISLSDRGPAAAGVVGLWPVDFTTAAYQFTLGKSAFVRSFGISLLRVALGVSLNIFLTILVAYALAKEVRQFRWRTAYVWFFVFTMLFSGGLIPGYIVVQQVGLINTIWALVIPGAVPVYLVVLLLNFFRGLPRELEEAAYIDGAGHWGTMWNVHIPLSLPALATITLFATVNHWNEWFAGLIFMNSPRNYPLASYLQTVIITIDSIISGETDYRLLGEINNRTTKAAHVFLGALPILAVYPVLQRYFISGIVLGSVKE